MAKDEAMPKVLLIDDDVDFLESSEATLVAAGFSVSTATSGEEGLALAREVRPNVIVLDLMLEHADAGFSVAYQLRKTPEVAEAPILMVTSASRDSGYRFDLANAEQRGWIKVDHILHKPVTGTELLAKVREAAERSPV